MKDVIESLIEYIADTLLVWIIIGCVSLLTVSSLTALCYLEGNAKAKYIEQTTGVELPWYEAMTLEVEIISTYFSEEH